MLRRMLWILFLVITCVAACAPTQERDAFIDAGPAASTADRDAAPVSTETPTVVSVWPDHGKAGDFVTITGNGFGLDPSETRVRIGGAPVEVASLRETEDGYQQLEVKVNEGTVSGPVSVYAADRWTTSSGVFCAQPVIHGLTLVQADEEATVHISGSNIDPFAVVYVGDVVREPQRLNSARRPHRFDATWLLIDVKTGDAGSLRIENPCPDGRKYSTASGTTTQRSGTD